MHFARLSLLLRVAVWACPILAAPALFADEQPQPFHEQIDALVESAAAGPEVPLCDDADFLRRAYLDLTGTIPAADTARTFLDDEDPAKRQKLVDRLLASPRFARHMQHTFDVMWMERRRDSGIARAEWQEYLRKHFEANTPLDQIAREILGADGSDPESRPAAKFYLDRQGEANLLARDVGRLFFGRDLQCAQCHDHPLIDDYLQSEYHGLMAFVNRGQVFTDAKDKNKVYFAELAEGEVSYESVFTGERRERVMPELPQGTPVTEPVLSKDEQYVVAPAKNVRPIPKFSRRAQLASLATSGTSKAFNRNLANRLWALMLGRGVVHPLDMHHSANPPASNELLTLLADELVRSKYDLKHFLREIALSQAYQRASIEPEPSQPNIDPGAISPALAAWQQEAEKLSAELPDLEEADILAAVALGEAYEKFAAAGEARDKAEKARAEAKQTSDEVAKGLADAVKQVATHDDVLKTLVPARKAADAAAAKLPEDKPLAEAAATIKQRTEETQAQLEAQQKIVAEKKPANQAASVKLAEADKKLAEATAALTQARSEVEKADAVATEAATRARAATARSNELTQRIEDAQRALDYQRLLAAASEAEAAAKAATEQLASLDAQESVTDEQRTAAESAAAEAQQKATTAREQAEAAWATIVERSTTNFGLAALKPLSPEQLAWATMQAVGLVDQQQAAQLAEAKKHAEAAGEMSPEDHEALQARLLEGLVDKKLAGNIKQFVELFGQQPGQPPAFQVTVHQALFLANGGQLAGWLNPANNNLTERLAAIEDPAALADELYLSVLTRRPTAEEQKQVTEYLASAGDERAAAVREMAWSLLTSAEFRFNR
ncbi:MAG: DUF1549 domain-containing protein [Planctomycetota bacterium]|nr:MAG: DUF1549 domain-containing protein [Planctomycetota bacterium]